MAIFFPSIHPSLLSSCRNASRETALPEAVLGSRIPYAEDFSRLLRLSYDRNGKQYHRDQDWHRSFLHLRLIREFI